MANVIYASDSDSAWSEEEDVCEEPPAPAPPGGPTSDPDGEAAEDSRDDEGDNPGPRQVPPCPYSTVAHCVVGRQVLVQKRDALTREVELRAAAYSASEIEAMQCESEELQCQISLHVLWQIDLNREKFAQHREGLPVWSLRHRLVSELEKNRVVIITGGTGSGKSTQIPQIVYDMTRDPEYTGSKKPILVAQTRRIAASSVAARVAIERGELLGESVGFSIGGLNAATKTTKIRFVTVGVLLAMLTNGRHLRDYSHVIIDEVHERTLEIDASLTMLKNIILHKKHTKLKVIIMSATLEGFRSRLQEYFQEANAVADSVTAAYVPVLSTPQRPNYQVSYLDDIADLVVGEGPGAVPAALFRNAMKPPRHTKLTNERMVVAAKLVIALHANVLSDEGNILIFLPGIADMTELQARLERSEKSTEIVIVQMHSTVSLEDQYHVFKRHEGKRLIVLATNIAESALTIRNLAVVIDFCLHKSNTHDPELGVSTLTLQWASTNMCTQRAGRCGRTFAGQVFRMVTRAEYSNLEDNSSPEILSTCLKTICLRVLAMRWTTSSVAQFLMSFLDAPRTSLVIKKALNDLSDLGLCKKVAEDSYTLTYLGKMVSLFNFDIHSAILVVYGCLYGCFTDAAVVASARTKGKKVVLNPFKQPMLGSMLDLCYAGPCLSDEIAAANAYHFWRQRRDAFLAEKQKEFEQTAQGTTPKSLFFEERDWCASKGLSLAALRDVHDTVLMIQLAASRAGICEPPLPAARGRQLQEKLQSLELLAATDVEEHAMLTLGSEGDLVQATKQVAQDLLLQLSTSALDDEKDQRLVKTRQQKALEKAYTRSEETLVRWVLDDGFREVEPFYLKADSQFSLTACIAGSLLHHSFMVGHTPTEGADPISHTVGDVHAFFVSLGLSHAIVPPAGSGDNKDGGSHQYVQEKKQFEEQLHVIRHDIKTSSTTKTEKLVKGEPCVPIHQLVCRPQFKKVELFLKSKAVAGRSCAGWFGQSGYNDLFVMRIACRLAERRLQVPPCFCIEEAAEKAKRGRNGKLLLPGKRSHAFLGGDTIAITEAKPHASIAASGVLTYAPPVHASRVRVTPRMGSLTYPLVIPRRAHVGFGFASRLSGRKRIGAPAAKKPSRVVMEAGTVVVGCPGAAELLVLLMDASVTIASVDVELAGTYDVVFATSRNMVKKHIKLRCSAATLTHVANIRQIGVERVARLHAAYVKHVKAAHKRIQQKVKNVPDFDESRLVSNTWTNPLAAYSNLTDLARRTSEEAESDEEAEDSGVIRHVTGGFVGVDLCADDEYLSHLTQQAAVFLSNVVQPMATDLSLPDPTRTLCSS